MIYPNKPLYLLSLLGYIYHLTYYTLTTKDNIVFPFLLLNCCYKLILISFSIVFLGTYSLISLILKELFFIK